MVIITQQQASLINCADLGSKVCYKNFLVKLLNLLLFYSSYWNKYLATSKHIHADMNLLQFKFQDYWFQIARLSPCLEYVRK